METLEHIKETLRNRITELNYPNHIGRILVDQFVTTSNNDFHQILIIEFNDHKYELPGIIEHDFEDLTEQWYIDLVKELNRISTSIGINMVETNKSFLITISYCMPTWA